MKYGYVSIATAAPEIKVADCLYNAASLCKSAADLFDSGANFIVFPELCITGYTCGDLFFQGTLQKGVDSALQYISDNTKEVDALLAVGAPLVMGHALYNCAVLFYEGEILGVVPKTHLPNYGEFYELRYFQPYHGQNTTINLLGSDVPFGTKLLFSCRNLPEFTVGIEICEDLWAPTPPSVGHAMAGATVIANLSAGSETLGKEEYRRQLVSGISARLLCAYAYANAGEGESTGDVVFSGHNLIAENGIVLSEGKPFSGGCSHASIDTKKLSFLRRSMNTFPPACEDGYLNIPFDMELRESPLPICSKTPFVPEDPAELAPWCEMVLAIQTAGLAKRIDHTSCKTVVLGVSGGLDSTLAILVCTEALKKLNRPTTDLLAVTMPGFGTTPRTKSNAEELVRRLGGTFKTISITDAVTVHFSDIGHDPSVTDVTYENAQARERTQILMDLANQTSGIVVGTGDLSELALGFATYNGDPMSMYGVNAGVPKTLIAPLIAHWSNGCADESLKKVLSDIIDTPVSPELLPPDGEKIAQKTEDVVGPYLLHDFFLFYAVRLGFSPKKIFYLCKNVFADNFTEEQLLHDMHTFYSRFFSQQFKRSCMPDGPKVGAVSLSPRGDWRMPSDASVALWLRELAGLEKNLDVSK